VHTQGNLTSAIGAPGAGKRPIGIDRNRLFAASCVAIATTGVVFSIRGDILDALGVEFKLSRYELGFLLSPAFWGNTVANVLGGSLVDFVGMRRLFFLSTLGYVAAIAIVLFTPAPVGDASSRVAFVLLYTGFLTFGLSQGLVEGVVNPLVATLYPTDKTHKLNVLHAWWPGGLIVGGLIAYMMTRLWALDSAAVSPDTMALGWRVKLAVAVVTPIAAALLVLRQPFPVTERVIAGVTHRQMFSEALRPMFLLWFALMWLTAATEVAPGQWIPSLITNLTGMQGILILIYTAGLAFALRLFAGGLAHRMSPIALLTISAALSAMGLYALSTIHTATQAFLAATVFGVGTAYFWPTMLSVTSERFPRGGAFLLALMGGAGNLAIAFVLPVIGRWYDTEGAAAAFRYTAVLPMVLTVVFGTLFIYYRSRGGYRPISLERNRNALEGAT
jgi:MFS family permease